MAKHPYWNDKYLPLPHPPTLWRVRISSVCTPAGGGLPCTPGSVFLLIQSDNCFLLACFYCILKNVGLILEREQEKHRFVVPPICAFIGCLLSFLLLFWIGRFFVFHHISPTHFTAMGKGQLFIHWSCYQMNTRMEGKDPSELLHKCSPKPYAAWRVLIKWTHSCAQEAPGANQSLSPHTGRLAIMIILKQRHIRSSRCKKGPLTPRFLPESRS